MNQNQRQSKYFIINMYFDLSIYSKYSIFRYFIPSLFYQLKLPYLALIVRHFYGILMVISFYYN